MSVGNDMIREMVGLSYRRDDVNCATTMLRILGKTWDFELHPQVLDAATGMHGAGCYGAQCGLVEGALMFLGVRGRSLGQSDTEVAELCNDFAGAFEARFGSLACRVLRPQGFAPDQPPHMCEELTVAACSWAAAWTKRVAARRPLDNGVHERS